VPNQQAPDASGNYVDTEASADTSISIQNHLVNDAPLQSSETADSSLSERFVQQQSVDDSSTTPKQIEQQQSDNGNAAAAFFQALMGLAAGNSAANSTASSNRAPANQGRGTQLVYCGQPNPRLGGYCPASNPKCWCQVSK
jgi:hypothetical protein